MRVGTKELKNRLSHYLRRVRSGEVLRVTDRGEEVAEIRAVPPQRSGNDDAVLAELEAEGLVTVGRGRFAPARPVSLRGSTSAGRAILEDRD